MSCEDSSIQLIFLQIVPTLLTELFDFWRNYSLEQFDSSFWLNFLTFDATICRNISTLTELFDFYATIWWNIPSQVFDWTFWLYTQLYHRSFWRKFWTKLFNFRCNYSMKHFNSDFQLNFLTFDTTIWFRRHYLMEHLDSSFWLNFSSIDAIIWWNILSQVFNWTFWLLMQLLDETF